MIDERRGDLDQDAFLQAARADERGLVAEFIAFMAENKVWWLAPILIVIALFGVLLVLGATGVAPFLYPFF
ncbi:MAG: hypothetical protein H6838_02900 [Planctomycetes bacterium]|nr:hypothetical protein [Planctomycetota bacterium]